MHSIPAQDYQQIPNSFIQYLSVITVLTWWDWTCCFVVVSWKYFRRVGYADGWSIFEHIRVLIIGFEA